MDHESVCETSEKPLENFMCSHNHVSMALVLNPIFHAITVASLLLSAALLKKQTQVVNRRSLLTPAG